VIDEADLAIGVPERDEIFSKQAHTQRRAVGFGQVRGLERGNPVLAEEAAHGSARADAREEVVF